MRSEQEMLDLILNIAKNDERVLAVYMNGSRANPSAPKDIYQDYDIVFVVTETKSFLADKSWISAFGNPLMVQEPDLNSIAWGDVHDFSLHYAWLILFDDGNRIDLGIEPKEETLKVFLDDKLTVTLLDKQGILPKLPPPTDEDYHVKKPTEGVFDACCNNFFWCLNNVAKGIARDELPYAMDMYNAVVRYNLNDMISWYIGIITDFSLSSGKMGKYFKRYLPNELYEMYTKTYSDSNYDNIWKSIFTSCYLFHTIGLKVAEHFGYSYNEQDEKNMRIYLGDVRSRGVLG